MLPVSDHSTSTLLNQDDRAVVELQKVDKAFRAGRRSVQALRQVSFQASQGCITGLIGPDGAGKTTLMRLAAGLLLPDDGQVRVVGLDMATDAPTVQRQISYMPQQFGLYEDLTVLENLDLYADLQGQPKSSRPDRYRELMKMTGLEPFLDRLAGHLSGGMKQKLGLACTLVRPPRLLLLDEPTAGVDPVSRRELWSIVNRSVENEKMSVLISTVYLDEAERCDEVVILDEGQVLDQGLPGSFSARLHNQTFVVSTPSLRPRVLRDRMADNKGVIDAMVHGAGVRLVMEQGCLPPDASSLPEVEHLDTVPVAPRFEDGFVALLREHAAASRRETIHANHTLSQVRHNAPNNTIIDVRDVQRRFGSFYAVSGITFNVQQGEVFGLLGANGAGKSTTFRMLCGLLSPSAGHLSVAGVDVRHAAAAARARIGYMSQKFSLYGTLSVQQNLRFFSSAYGLGGRRRASRIQWAIEQFGLDTWLEAQGDDLPLGCQKRLSMACALMHEPDVLFLDEPTSGVDPLARRDFWRQINNLSAQGVTVLVTTHFMEEAEYCDRLAIMAEGRLLVQGTPESIRDTAPRREGHEPTIEDAFIHLIETNLPTKGE